MIPTIGAPRRRLASGDLGRPFLFQSLQFDMEPPPLAFADPRVSGGIWVDMGIHEFDLARWLMEDEVVEVMAYGSTLTHPDLATVGDVDSGVAILRFAGGATGSVRLARDTTYGEDVRTEVTASRRLGVGGHAAPGARRSERIGRRRRSTAWTRPCRASSAPTRSRRATSSGPIVEHRPVSVTGADSRAALAIALAADRSMREGRPVAVAEVSGG